MPDFSDREQILNLKLLWMKSKLKGLDDKFFNSYMCLLSIDVQFKEASKHLAMVQHRLDEIDKLRGYIYLDLGEISQEIAKLKDI